MPTKSAFIIATALLLVSARVGYAESIAIGHLPMPASFDQATVQRLIANIDQDHNASVLEFGYFLRRSTQPFPQSYGFALLKSAAEKEVAGSKKWFLLESVIGVAALRAPGVSPYEGLVAYDSIFSHASDATKSKATGTLRRAIRFFVFSVTGRLPDIGLRFSPLIGKLMLKAWSAALILPPDRLGAPEPLWAEAILRAHLESDFTHAMNTALTNTSMPKTYGLLKAAAVVFDETDPVRSLKLLQQAKPLMPDDPVEQQWYEQFVTQVKNYKAAVDRKN